MALSITEIFGTDATLDVTTPSDPILQIRLQNLQDTGTGAGEITGGIGLDDVSAINQANIDSYSHKIITALLMLHRQNYLTVDPNLLNQDETLGTTIEFNPLIDKQFVLRNNVSQIQFRILVGIYVDDNSSSLDPDDVKNA